LGVLEEIADAGVAMNPQNAFFSEPRFAMKSHYVGVRVAIQIGGGDPVRQALGLDDPFRPRRERSHGFKRFAAFRLRHGRPDACQPSDKNNEPRHDDSPYAIHVVLLPAQAKGLARERVGLTR